MKPNMSIWWKLSFASVVINIIGIPVWLTIHAASLPDWFPFVLILPLMAILAVPALYLSVFTIWHWRNRYAGTKPLAWLVVFVICSWPLIASIPGSVVIALAYFFVHVLPDTKQKGDYAKPDLPRKFPSPSPVPEAYKLVKSTCFVLGWVLILGSILITAIYIGEMIYMWDTLQKVVANEIGNEITETTASSIWVGAQTAKIVASSSLITVIAVAIGAVLIQVSQLLRWRLMEEKDRIHLTVAKQTDHTT